MFLSLNDLPHRFTAARHSETELVRRNFTEKDECKEKRQHLGSEHRKEIVALNSPFIRMNSGESRLSSKGSPVALLWFLLIETFDFVAKGSDDVTIERRAVSNGEKANESFGFPPTSQQIILIKESYTSHESLQMFDDCVAPAQKKEMKPRLIEFFYRPCSCCSKSQIKRLFVGLRNENFRSAASDARSHRRPPITVDGINFEPLRSSSAIYNRIWQFNLYHFMFSFLLALSVGKSASPSI